MKQADVPLYRADHYDFLDEYGEERSATTEYWRRHERNIDTFQQQEAFMAAVCAETLQYK
jgi:hypothetical protein